MANFPTDLYLPNTNWFTEKNPNSGLFRSNQVDVKYNIAEFIQQKITDGDITLPSVSDANGIFSAANDEAEIGVTNANIAAGNSLRIGEAAGNSSIFFNNATKAWIMNSASGLATSTVEVQADVALTISHLDMIAPYSNAITFNGTSGITVDEITTMNITPSQNFTINDPAGDSKIEFNYNAKSWEVYSVSGSYFARVDLDPGGGLLIQHSDGVNSHRIFMDSNGIRINNEYYLPPTDGTAGQVLTTNGAGVLSWVTP